MAFFISVIRPCILGQVRGSWLCREKGLTRIQISADRNQNRVFAFSSAENIKCVGTRRISIVNDKIKRPARSFIDVQAGLLMLKSGSDLI